MYATKAFEKHSLFGEWEFSITVLAAQLDGACGPRLPIVPSTCTCPCPYVSVHRVWRAGGWGQSDTHLQRHVARARVFGEK